MGRLFVALVFAAVLSGCAGGKNAAGSPAARSGTLHVYNWTYYLPAGVIGDFEKKFGIKVVYENYSSNEELYARLKAGGKPFDVIFPSGDYAAILIREKMVRRLDKSLIPNLKHLDRRIVRKITYDRSMDYSVPFVMGAAGIAVNKTKVSHYARDYRIFSNPGLKNRMTLLDDMREVMGSALGTLGYSANTVNRAELRRAKALVMEWKRNILKFDAENFARGFAAGEYWVVQGYLENIALELTESQKSNADLFIPKKGGTMYVDGMMIPADSPRPDLAHLFINYIHEPEVYARIADYLTLPSVNSAARRFTTNKTLYSIEDLEACEIKDDLGKALGTYNAIWQEIRVGY